MKSLKIEIILLSLLLSPSYSFAKAKQNPGKAHAKCFKLDFRDVDENIKETNHLSLASHSKQLCVDESKKFGDNKSNTSIKNKVNFKTCECLVGDAPSKQDRSEVLTDLYHKLHIKNIQDKIDDKVEFNEFQLTVFSTLLFNEELPVACKNFQESADLCSDEQADALFAKLKIPRSRLTMMKNLFTGKSLNKFNKHQDLINNKNLKHDDNPEVFKLAKTALVRDFMKYKKSRANQHKKKIIHDYSEVAHGYIEKFNDEKLVLGIIGNLKNSEMSYVGGDYQTKVTNLAQAIAKELVLFKSPEFLQYLEPHTDNEEKMLEMHDNILNRYVAGKDNSAKLSKACTNFQSLVTSSCAATKSKLVASPKMIDLLEISSGDTMKEAAVLCYDAQMMAKKRGHDKLSQAFFDELFSAKSIYSVNVQLASNTVGDTLAPDEGTTGVFVGNGKQTSLAMADAHGNGSMSAGDILDNKTFVGNEKPPTFEFGEISERVFSKLDGANLDSSLDEKEFGSSFLGNAFASNAGNGAIMESIGDSIGNANLDPAGKTQAFNGVKTFDKFITTKSEESETQESVAEAAGPVSNQVSPQGQAYDNKLNELAALEKRTQDLLSRLEQKMSDDKKGKSVAEVVDPETKAKEEELASLKAMIADLKKESESIVAETKVNTSRPTATRSPASFGDSPRGFAVSSGGSGTTNREPSATPTSSTGVQAQSGGSGSGPIASSGSTNGSSSKSSKSLGSSSEGSSLQLSSSRGSSNKGVSFEDFRSMTTADFQKLYEENGNRPLVVKEIVLNSEGKEEEVEVLYEPVVIDGIVSYKKLEKELKDLTAAPSRSIASVEEEPKNTERMDRAIKQHKRLIELMNSKLFE